MEGYSRADLAAYLNELIGHEGAAEDLAGEVMRRAQSRPTGGAEDPRRFAWTIARLLARDWLKEKKKSGVVGSIDRQPH